MKRDATYTLLDGSQATLSYDSLDPCVVCGLPVVEASMGGTALCPWCDIGRDRQGRPQVVRQRLATGEERAMGKTAYVFAPKRATEAEYLAARAALEAAEHGV